MKKCYFFLLSMMGTMSVHAQDVITKRDGDELQVKVIKITDAEVEYKKWNNLDGPAYTMKKREIFMIKYQNGEKDVFKEENPVLPTGNNEETADNNDGPVTEPVSLLAKPSDDNEAYIKRINNSYIPPMPKGIKQKKE